jgi:hypothetical protein
MKKNHSILVLIATILLVACSGKSEKTIAETELKSNVIEVIDFHSTHRCMTCNAIEANTKYTLETFFADELQSGKITFKVINVDLKENESIAQAYEAYGTSLFLNVVINGAANKIDLTEFAFTNGNDKDTFSSELKAKLENELTKM